MRVLSRWPILAPRENPGWWARGVIAGGPWRRLSEDQVSSAWEQDSVPLRRNAVLLVYALIPGGILVYTVGPLAGWIATAAAAVPLLVHQIILADRMAMSPESVSIHTKYSRRRRAISTRLLFPPAPGRSTELFWYRTFILSIAGLYLIGIALLAVLGWDWLWAPYLEM